MRMCISLSRKRIFDTGSRHGQPLESCPIVGELCVMRTTMVHVRHPGRQALFPFGDNGRGDVVREVTPVAT